MEISDFKEGDEKDILELFNKAFNKKLSLEYWKWRYRDNPTRKTMIKLMWDNGVLTGHYAVSPVEMIVENKVSLSALSMTTMTHPDYGGRGIFTTLAESLYSEIEEKYGVQSVWGFPNNNSHYGLIKNLKWKDLAVIPTLSIDLNNFTGKKNDSFEVKENFSKKNEEAVLSFYTNQTIAVNRTKEYLNWRYVQNPVNNYIIFEKEQAGVNNFAVTKSFTSFDGTGRKEVDITEIFFPSDFPTLVSLITEIRDYYIKETGDNISKLNLWLPLRDRKHILFERMGFTNNEPITYFGIRGLTGNGSKMEDISKWLYSMGDSDIY